MSVQGLPAGGVRVLRAARGRQHQGVLAGQQGDVRGRRQGADGRPVRRARRVRPVPPVPAVQRPALRQEPAAVQDAQGAFGESEGGAGYYVHLGADGMLAGAGYYSMAKDQLERFRAAVDDDATGTEVAAHRRRAGQAPGYAIGAIDELKSAPRGYPKDHPRDRAAAAQGPDGVAAVRTPARGCTRRRRRPRSARRGRARRRCAPGSTPTSARAPLPPDDADVAVTFAGGRQPLDRMSTVTVTDVRMLDALESQFGLADRVVDDDALANSVERFRERGIALPTFAELADPSTIDHDRVGDADPQGRRRPQPVAGPLVQRPRRRPGRRARARRAAVVADRRREPDHRRVRRPLPDDHRAQGARRLRLPGAADRHRPVRPDPPPGDLAVDRQLRPRRHRHQPDHGQPRRGHPARGDEPGALRLARPVVREPGRRRHPHAGHGVQRQGDLRRLQRAGPRSRQRRAQPVLRVRQPPRPLRGHRPGAGARLRRGRRRVRGCASPRSCRRPARPARSPPATG